MMTKKEIRYAVIKGLAERRYPERRPYDPVNKHIDKYIEAVQQYIKGREELAVVDSKLRWLQKHIKDT
jgi:hypothetical protein